MHLKANKEFNITATGQNNKNSMALLMNTFRLRELSKHPKIFFLINFYKMFINIYKFELMLSSDMARLYVDIN